MEVMNYKFNGNAHTTLESLEEAIKNFKAKDQYTVQRFAVIKLAIPSKNGGYIISPKHFTGVDFFSLERDNDALFMFNSNLDGCLLQGITYKHCLLALNIAREEYFKKHFCDRYIIEYENMTTEEVAVDLDYEPVELDSIL